MLHSISEIKKKLEHLNSDTNFQNHVNNIKPGKFRRNPQNPDYQSRLIYTKELRLFVYNQAVMNEIYSDSSLKDFFFRTFGYKGNLNFTIYPDAWIRDLPLWDIGENCYLGDGILMGTNIVRQDQQVLSVGSIKIGDNTIFNQKCAVGFNLEIGKNCAIGYNCTVGVKGKVGDNTTIGEYSFIGHGTKVGSNVTIGQYCYIGNMSQIEDGVCIENATKIPPFTKITQEGHFNLRPKYNS